jgi:hypothetical protein
VALVRTVVSEEHGASETSFFQEPYGLTPQKTEFFDSPLYIKKGMVEMTVTMNI